MKKTLFVFVLLCIFSCACAESIDLSGLSFADLSFLRDKCQLEMMKRDEWQEVTVPVGVYEVGKEIPAGHWTIKASTESTHGWGNIQIGDKLDKTGKDLDVWSCSYYWASQICVEDKKEIFNIDTVSIDLDLKKGCFIIVEYLPMVFSPYTGKPDLGFK